MFTSILRFLLALSSCYKWNITGTNADKIGLLIIPGLGRGDRLETVLHNLQRLEKFIGSTWDCVVYVYVGYDDVKFWSLEGLQHLQNKCEVVVNANKRVTENLYMVKPESLKQYNYVFILLDDCKLTSGRRYFPLDRVIDIMVANQLTVVTPKVIGANKGGGQKFRTIMQKDEMPGTLGYVSNFVEIFAWVTTIPAYNALWQLLYPSINPYGWGYDFWYDNFARVTVPNHKMGIISAIHVLHDQNSSSEFPESGRTDNAKVSEKWGGVMEQERYYSRHLGIPLRKYRTKLRLFNDSWNGAVTGYVYAPKGYTSYDYIKILLSQ